MMIEGGREGLLTPILFPSVDVYPAFLFQKTTHHKPKSAPARLLIHSHTQPDHPTH